MDTDEHGLITTEDTEGTEADRRVLVVMQMAKQPLILNYATTGLGPNRPTLEYKIERAWRAGVIVAVLLLIICLVTECENAHFEGFFPRRAEIPESVHLAPLEMTSVRTEDGWLDWKVMITEDTSWWHRTLTPKEEAERRRWIADRWRWNCFVVLVKAGSLFQLALLAIAIRIEFFLVSVPVHKKPHWDLLGKLAIGAVILVGAGFLFARGYLGLFLPDF